MKFIFFIALLSSTITYAADTKAPVKRAPSSTSSPFYNFNIEQKDVIVIKQKIAESLKSEKTKRILAQSKCKVDDSSYKVLTMRSPSEIGILPVAQNTDDASNTIELYATDLSLCMGNKCQGYDTKVLKVTYTYNYDKKSSENNQVEVFDCFNTDHSF